MWNIKMIEISSHLLLSEVTYVSTLQVQWLQGGAHRVFYLWNYFNGRFDLNTCSLETDELWGNYEGYILNICKYVNRILEVGKLWIVE